MNPTTPVIGETGESAAGPRIDGVWVRLGEGREYVLTIDEATGRVGYRTDAALDASECRRRIDIAVPVLAVPRALSSANHWRRYWRIAYGVSPRHLERYTDFQLAIDYLMDISEHSSPPVPGSHIPVPAMVVQMLYWWVRRTRRPAVGLLYHTPWLVTAVMDRNGRLGAVQRDRVDDPRDLPYYAALAKSQGADEEAVAYVGGDEELWEAVRSEGVRAAYPAIEPLALDHLWQDGAKKVPQALRPYAGVVLCVS